MAAAATTFSTGATIDEVVLATAEADVVTAATSTTGVVEVEEVVGAGASKGDQ